MRELEAEVAPVLARGSAPPSPWPLQEVGWREVMPLEQKAIIDRI
ncbi:MAG: hypothetical protein ACYCS9_03400 [Candidatus Dormibacteria bacterium]